jgi:hypothetical protein
MKNQPASIPIGIRGFHLPLAAGEAALRKPIAIARSPQWISQGRHHFRIGFWFYRRWCKFRQRKK